MEKISNSYYRLGGLVIVSELPLPGLQALPAQQADVSIRLGIAPFLTSKRDAREIESGCLATVDEYLHAFPGIVTFYIRGGEEIIIQPVDLTRLDEIRSLLYSVIFATLFYRRGMLPIHASAIKSEDQIFGFMGRSGAGKSTLVAHLRRRGYQVTSDDLLLLNTMDDGVTRVTPCAPWLKLWEDAFDGLGSQITCLEPIAGKESKFMVPLNSGDDDEILPLSALFLLESNSSDTVHFTRLAPAAAIAKVMLYVYPILLIHKLGNSEDLFRQCGQILNHIPVFAFSRPWDLTRFDTVLDQLEAKFAEVAIQQPCNKETADSGKCT